MGYVTRTLGDEEEVLLRARFNWTRDAAAWGWFVVGASPLIVGLATSIVRATPLELFAGLPAWSACAALALGALHCLSRYIDKWTTVIAVTTARLVYKRGMFARDSREVSIGKIEEVDLHQSFLGRIFDFGALTVGGEGVGLIHLPAINDPMAFRRALEEAVVRYQNNSAPARGHAKPRARVAVGAR